MCNWQSLSLSSSFQYRLGHWLFDKEYHFLHNNNQLLKFYPNGDLLVAAYSVVGLLDKLTFCFIHFWYHKCDVAFSPHHETSQLLPVECVGKRPYKDGQFRIIEMYLVLGPSLLVENRVSGLFGTTWWLLRWCNFVATVYLFASPFLCVDKAEATFSLCLLVHQKTWDFSKRGRGSLRGSLREKSYVNQSWKGFPEINKQPFFFLKSKKLKYRKHNNVS